MTFAQFLSFEQNGYHRERYKENIEDFNKRLQNLKTESNKRSQELLKEFGEQLEPLVEQVRAKLIINLALLELELFNISLKIGK